MIKANLIIVTRIVNQLNILIKIMNHKEASIEYQVKE